MLTTDTRFSNVRFGRGATILRAKDEPISIADLEFHAPAVLATGKHESRSDRYEFLNTRSVVEGLLDNGFAIHEVRQAGSKIPGKREFTKHLLRLRYRGEEGHAANVRGHDKIIPEVIITNAHDGTSSWQMGAGCFRIVCSNGLVCGDLFDYVKVGHTRSAPEKVIDAAFTVIKDFPRVIDDANGLASIELSGQEQLAFADAARQLRWDGEAPVEPARLLRPRREEDRLADLWTTMNRVQENVIQGGIAYTNTNAETGRVSRRHTGEVRAIDQTRQLNRALWTLADHMANLKQAA